MSDKSAHHHGNLRQALLDRAMEAARQGTIEELSLRQVSRELGVSAGAAYRHFDSKESLLREVAALGFDKMAAAFEAAMPFDTTPRDSAEAVLRFARLGQAYVVFARENYGLWRLMFGPTGVPMAETTHRGANTYLWLQKTIQELYDTDLLRREPNHDDEMLLWSMVHGMADLSVSPTLIHPMDEAMMFRLCSRVLRGFLAAA
ncbi:MAG: TetR/AcrR family transcriptional regulator [Pseudorhodobacter sp.]